MSSLMIFGTFIAMLCVILFHEGWKKALKILGLWLGSFILLVLIEIIFRIKTGSSASAVIALLFWGLWDIGLVIYNIKEGYMGNIRVKL